MSDVRATRTIMAIGKATPRWSQSRRRCWSLMACLPVLPSREIVPDLGVVRLAEIERGDLARLQLHAQTPGRLSRDPVRQHVRPGRNTLELEPAAVVGS